MKTAEIVKLLKDGKKPMVKLTNILWDDSFGQKGMIARITSFTEHQDDTTELMFEYNEQKAHNLSLQEHNWYVYKDGQDTGKLGTIFEAGSMKEDNIFEEIYFNDGDDVPVELADGSPILAEFLKSGSTLSYVEWLEKQLDELVPECMKSWGEKLCF
jgi:hypothetical protein